MSDTTAQQRAEGCSEEVRAWADRGEIHHLAGHGVFVVDVPAADPDPALEPLLVLHGFPTSTFDYAGIIDRLAAHRRVIAADFLGFGLSDKPDLHYTMGLQADLIVALTAELGLERIALLSHDMGDTVGGELLARNTEGAWPIEVTRRVVTNGSIYIEMANLTAGQLMLLSLPDEKAPGGTGVELLAASLAATLAPANAHLDMTAHAELTCHAEGDALLPRTIRYIEERRANERRFTGAIEDHPAPLHVIWGPEDPIAVAGMAERLVAARSDATLTWIDGAGHFPQTEAPAAWLAAVEVALT